MPRKIKRDVELDEQTIDQDKIAERQCLRDDAVSSEDQ
jgi:hypothetical protein